MKSQNSRRILLIVLALLGAIGLVVASAVATVFAYRQFGGDQRVQTAVDLGALQLGENKQDDGEGDTEAQGVLVLRVDAGSPAEQAGLVSGAVILSVNGQAVNSPQELKDAINKYEVGDTVTLTIQDGEDKSDITVTLGDSGPYLGVSVGPSGGSFHIHGGHFGEMPHGFLVPRFPGAPGESDGSEGRPFMFPFDDFDQFDHGHFFDMMGKSALIMSVADESPAADAGLQPGDAVVEANGQVIEDSQALVDLIAELAPGDSLALQVQRGTETISFDVTLASHPDDEGRAFLGVSLMPGPVHRQLELFDDQQSS